MKSDVVCTMFALCLYVVCSMFVLCLHYVLMSFDVKIGKIAKEGNRQQALGTSGEKSEIRSQKTGGKRADRLGCGLKEWAVRGQGKKRGGKRLGFC